MSKPVMIDPKVIYEVLPDLPKKKYRSICKMCNKKMRALGELTTIMAWCDYFDGNIEKIDLCESCAKIVIKEIKSLVDSGKSY